MSLAATASVFDAVRWPVYAGGNILIGLTYALVGALLAPLFGRVGGVFMAFLLPFLDLGITQTPMLRPQPANWARALPGYGGLRVLLDGALTRGFDESGWGPPRSAPTPAAASSRSILAAAASEPPAPDTRRVSTRWSGPRMATCSPQLPATTR